MKKPHELTADGSSSLRAIIAALDTMRDELDGLPQQAAKNIHALIVDAVSQVEEEDAAYVAEQMTRAYRAGKSTAVPPDLRNVVESAIRPEGKVRAALLRAHDALVWCETHHDEQIGQERGDAIERVGEALGLPVPPVYPAVAWEGHVAPPPADPSPLEQAVAELECELAHQRSEVQRLRLSLEAHTKPAGIVDQW